MCCWPYASFYDKESAGNWYEYGNLFDILRQAGIHTAWLSDQEASGFYGSIDRTLAGRCDNQAFTSHLSHTIDLSDRYDEEILPLLDAKLSGDEGRYRSSFYVLHLMGHMRISSVVILLNRQYSQRVMRAKALRLVKKSENFGQNTIMPCVTMML